MSQKEIRIARVFLHEKQHLLTPLLELLHDEEKIAGVTVLRGIAGFGESGEIHTASLVDLSTDLPLMIEFYDEPEKVNHAIERIQAEQAVRHIVSWPAVSHLTD